MSEATPEFYGEVFYIRTTPWGVAVTFAVPPAKDASQAKDICVVRMSHETAKTISMMLRTQLKNYERDTSTSIAIPMKVMNDLGLAPEDW